MDWPVITILPLHDLRDLPRYTGGARWACAGVYFVWDDQATLVYIGSAKLLTARMGAHKREWYFGCATILEVPSPWHAAVEIPYIEHYRPINNANHNSAAGRRGSKSRCGWSAATQEARRQRAEWLFGKRRSK